MTPPNLMEIALLLLAILVPTFAFVSVAVWTEARRKEREAFYQQELLRKLADSPVPQAQLVIEVMREQELQKEQRVREGLKLGGLITSLVGIAMAIMVAALEQSKPAWTVGLIPLFVGAGLLVYAYLLAPRTPAVGQR
jgi:hypothetical protein